MRALVAAAVLACLRCAHAADLRDVTDRDDVTAIPLRRLLKCATSIGPSRCLNALAAYRVEHALTSIRERRADFNLANDIQNFQWDGYANKSEDQVYSQLCDGTEKLLQYRAMKFNVIPGYELQLQSNGNGTLNLDLFNRDPEDAARGMKKWRKKFYSIVPILLLPGLIMSAVLPFVLPALKMMTVAVGMLNNMALSGAIFTLLRNNAFNDKYDKKVIYVNEGYHNEKHAKHHHEYHDSHKPENVIDFGAHESQIHTTGEEYVVDEPLPADMDWYKKYHGPKFFKIADEDYKREHG